MPDDPAALTMKLTTLESVELKSYRKSVAAFGKQMSGRLMENNHKEGWEDCSFKYLLWRLRQEVEELASAVKGGMAHFGEANDIVLEAADVGNFAMMIAERARVLERDPHA